MSFYASACVRMRSYAFVCVRCQYQYQNQNQYQNQYQYQVPSLYRGREYAHTREKRNYFLQNCCILRFTVLECNYETRRYSSRTTVPVWPWMPSRAFSSSVMRALRPGFERANFTAASTLGSMEPGAKCPWAMYSSAMAGVS